MSSLWFLPFLELEPRLFSFNAPFGSCPDCDGLGIKLEVDLDLVVPDDRLTLREGALAPLNPISSNYYPQMLEQAMIHFVLIWTDPFSDLFSRRKRTWSSMGQMASESTSTMKMSLVGFGISKFLLKGS